MSAAALCLNCLLLQPRKSSEGLTMWWCPRKKVTVGPDFFCRPACRDYALINAPARR